MNRKSLRSVFIKDIIKKYMEKKYLIWKRGEIFEN